LKAVEANINIIPMVKLLSLIKKVKDKNNSVRLIVKHTKMDEVLKEGEVLNSLLDLCVGLFG
jgi:hypothetical protein